MHDENQELQKFTITTDDMIFITIDNKNGKSTNGLYVEDLRKLLKDDFNSLPAENRRVLK